MAKIPKSCTHCEQCHHEPGDQSVGVGDGYFCLVFDIQLESDDAPYPGEYEKIAAECDRYYPPTAGRCAFCRRQIRKPDGTIAYINDVEYWRTLEAYRGPEPICSAKCDDFAKDIEADVLADPAENSD